jgi:hypothetical protein
MKTFEMIIRRALFYVAVTVAAVAVCQKIANISGYTLWRELPELSRLIEITAIALLFNIAMQLHQIRLLLGPKSGGSPK